MACVSPWNFPLAIFTGQIAGALAAGCGVLAKPAEQTPLVAALAVKLLHDAGVPKAVLQLLPGDGLSVGGPLTSDPRINAVAFTGSTETAKHIRRAMAENLAPGAPLIAETGGLNAMIPRLCLSKRSAMLSPRHSNPPANDAVHSGVYMSRMILPKHSKICCSARWTN